MSEEAIVAINKEGSVRAYCLISPGNQVDERIAKEMTSEWLMAGRTVRRCSASHALSVAGSQWREPEDSREQDPKQAPNV